MAFHQPDLWPSINLIYGLPWFVSFDHNRSFVSRNTSLSPLDTCGVSYIFDTFALLTILQQGFCARRSLSESSPLSAYGYPNMDFAPRNLPRLSCSLPPLTASELQDDPDLESLISAASSDWEYRPRTSTVHSVPEEILRLGTPLPRRLRSAK